MKRSIELLENADTERLLYSKDFAELNNKLHEIRRDSIRFTKMIKNPYRFKKLIEGFGNGNASNLNNLRGPHGGELS